MKVTHSSCSVRSWLHIKGAQWRPMLARWVVHPVAARRPRWLLGWMTAKGGWPLWTWVRSSVWTLNCALQTNPGANNYYMLMHRLIDQSINSGCIWHAPVVACRYNLMNATHSMCNISCTHVMFVSAIMVHGTVQHSYISWPLTTTAILNWEV